MKLLIIIGLIPLFSADQFSSGLTSNDDIKTFRMKSDTLTASLKFLSYDPKASIVMEKIFTENNTCLNNIDEVITAIQQSTKIVEAASGELKSLNNQVEALVEMTDEAEVLNQVAAIFRAMQPLLEDLSPAIPAGRICESSSENTEAYLRSLATILHEFSYNPEVSRNQETRNMHYKSGNTLFAVSALLRQIRIQSERFQSFCFPNKESTMEGIEALGEILGSMADMFSVLGNLRVGKKIRQGKVMADRIAVGLVFLTSYFLLTINFPESSPSHE